MRRIVLAILIVPIITLILTSCSLGGSEMFRGIFDDDQKISNDRMEKILLVLQEKDEDALRKMFSKNAITQAENFDGSIIELFDFFKGEFESYNDWSGPIVEEGRNDDGTGRNWKSTESTFDVITSEQKYRFAIKVFTKDTTEIDNIGIYSMYVIKMEDTNEEFAYWGDNKWSPGINIGIKNEKTDIE